VTLLQLLEDRGWLYDNGHNGPPTSGRVVSECYPYTAIVGAEELGYEVERPRYKQKPPKGMRAAEWKPLRAITCDELIRRLGSLATADPPLDLRSHPATLELLEQPSPLDARQYKHREDLIDAIICAWSASLWHRHSFSRSQVLGPSPEGSSAERLATIIAPARPDERERT
jgi:predicted RNase H-like nuclease